MVWPLDEVKAPGEVLLEVAGFRYQGVDLNEMKVGTPASFVLEPENKQDNKAIGIHVGGRRIRYVKRLQRDAVAHWLTHYHVEAFLERFNGTPKRPIIYVFCRLAERHPIALARTAAG